MSAEEVSAQVAAMARELEQTQEGSHPEYLQLLATLEATRARLLDLAQARYALAQEHARHAYEAAVAQVEADHALAREDVKERIYARLRQRKRDLREALERLQPRAPEYQGCAAALHELKVPQRRRERRAPPGAPGLAEADARQDVQAVRAAAAGRRAAE